MARCLQALLLCALWAGAARAQALNPGQALSGCAEPEDRGRGFKVLFPRPGLPALVAGSQLLEIHLRLPAPLTPPPGVQQQRVLSAWQAKLTGGAHDRPGADASPSYNLPVVNVRPLSGSGMAYRAYAVVPAWAAPGTYSLTIRAPGGTGSVRAAVRVLAPAAAPRLAWLGAMSRPAPLGDLPVDLWLVRPGDPTAALGHRASWVVASDCSRAKLAPMVGTTASPDPDHYQPVGAGPRALPGASDISVTRDPRGYRIKSDGAPPGLELLLAVDGSWQRLDSDVPVTFYPAGDQLDAKPPRLVAMVQPGKGASARLTAAPPLVRTGNLGADPQPGRTGQAVKLFVEGVPAGARVAWQLDWRTTGWGPVSTSLRRDRVGAHRVVALAIDGQGQASALERTLQVDAHVVSGCRLWAPPGSPIGQEWPLVLGPVLTWLWTRRLGKKARQGPGRE